MSFSIYRSVDVTVKMELAERLAGSAMAPEQALRSVFEGAMKAIQEKACQKFEDTLKEKVWSQVSTEKLKHLKEFLLLEFCDKILGHFNEIAVKNMLNCHKTTGVISEPKCKKILHIVYQMHREAIEDSVMKEAQKMLDGWYPEIVNAVREEGIELSEPKAE